MSTIYNTNESINEYSMNNESIDELIDELNEQHPCDLPQSHE